MTQFAVADVEPATKAVATVAHRDLLKHLAGTPVEACSSLGRPVVEAYGYNQFIEAAGFAFARHHPLVLTPDAIWLTLAQGLANHINQNAETVRRRFVAHEGKVEIVVRRDGFIKGSAENDWEGVFDEFSSVIRSHIGLETHRSIVADFSTTGRVERAASEVVLMDAMQSFFSYGMMTSCGIPRVELTGTVEDWEALRDKVRAWGTSSERTTPGGIILPATDLGLSWWLGPLSRVLDEFVAAAEGRPDTRWWDSFYKENGGFGSGAVSRVSGWINWLFPYVGQRKLGQNPVVGRDGLKYGDGLEESAYPSSLSKVPFKWNYYGKIFEMDFLAGVTSIVQDQETLALTPTAGWGVRERAK